MNTIYFKKRFYFLLLISIAVLEYFLIANIYSSKSDEKKIVQNCNYNLGLILIIITRKFNYITLRIHNSYNRKNCYF
jgi:hypothetical protein